MFIVDDDEMVRRGIARLVRSVGLAAETYSSPRVLLAQGRREAAGCIVLDLHMPDLDGLQAQEALSQAGYTLPVLFLTGHGDVSSSVTAMKAGAIDFLVKPVNHGELLDAIQRAVDRDLAPAPNVSRPARCASGSRCSRRGSAKCATWSWPGCATSRSQTAWVPRKRP